MKLLLNTNSLLFTLSISPFVKSQDNTFDCEIVGGTETTPGRYAYQVALFDNCGQQQCGGSLIAPGYVLAAAHCSFVVNKAYIGCHDLSDSSETYEEINIDTKNISSRDYDALTFNNDII